MAEEKPKPLTDKLTVNDRVKRKNGQGCHGVVKDIRAEVTATTGDTKEKALLVNVLWDNGTASYFTVEALERV